MQNNTKKSVALLHTDKLAKEVIQFTIVTHNIIFFAVTLIKQVKYWYNKNFQCVKIETEKHRCK